MEEITTREEAIARLDKIAAIERVADARWKAHTLEIDKLQKEFDLIDDEIAQTFRGRGKVGTYIDSHRE